MKIIVDEINPQYCPFYVDRSWDDHDLPIEYCEGCCKLDTTPYMGELQQDQCYAKEGDKECPFCITYEEFKRRMSNAY